MLRKCIRTPKLTLMKYVYLAVISLILLQSCSLTQRRYLPGFSVNWNHRAPKTCVNKNTKLARNYTNHYRTTSIAAKPLSIATENPLDNFVIPYPLKTTPVFQPKITHTNHTLTTSNEPLLSSQKLSTDLSIDPPTHENPTKEVCQQAKVSQHTGMLSLTLTLFLFAVGLMLIVVKNSGGLWATSNLTSAVFIGGAAMGGVLGLIAIIFGIVALHKIHMEQALYSGTGKAVTGIVFACILFGILALIFIK